MNRRRVDIRALLSSQAPFIMLAIVFLTFGAMAPRFLELANLRNILIQSSSLGIAAVGITFALLTAGIDLSVGSIMFIASVAFGKLIVGGFGGAVAAFGALGAALVYGVLNATLITRAKLIPFVVTLATLYVGRGAGLLATETRAMNLPIWVQHIGSSKPLGIPLPVLVFALVAVLAHVVLTRTAFGRQLYAVGYDAAAARKAGIRVDRVILGVYVICGVCAGIAGLVAVVQVGVVSPSFGQQRELTAIAAAVLGGASLFGGKGKVLPGAVLGAVLIQSVENGLVVVGADAYLHPMIMATVILLAVLTDGVRRRQLARAGRRQIRRISA